MQGRGRGRTEQEQVQEEGVHAKAEREEAFEQTREEKAQARFMAPFTQLMAKIHSVERMVAVFNTLEVPQDEHNGRSVKHGEYCSMRRGPLSDVHRGFLGVHCEGPEHVSALQRSQYWLALPFRRRRRYQLVVLGSLLG
jgi:hypothetical protein